MYGDARASVQVPSLRIASPPLGHLCLDTQRLTPSTDAQFDRLADAKSGYVRRHRLDIPDGDAIDRLEQVTGCNAGRFSR